MTARLLSESDSTEGTVSLNSTSFIIMFSIACALVCAVVLIGIASCAWKRFCTDSSNPLRKSLKERVLESLPKFTYGGENSNPFTAECAICLSEYASGDEIRVLPQCGHGFHALCVDTWLGSHSSCPSCRKMLKMVRCEKCRKIPREG